MKQIYHIFRKDLRQHRLEITVSLALLAGFAWRTPAVWQGTSTIDGPSPATWLLISFGVALVLSWLLLVVRVIHGEPLVGDRHFWLTRPYERRWLIVSKALFILAFINFPVLIFDVVVLVVFGFSPIRSFEGLVVSQLQLTVLIALPTAVIAAVTETLIQVLLCILALAVYLTVTIWAASHIPSANVGDAGSNVGAVISLLVLGGCLAALTLQYFRRATPLSRWLLVGSLCAAALIDFVAPYGFFMERSYPRAAPDALNPSDLHIDRNEKQRVSDDRLFSRSFSIVVPVSTNGTRPGSIVDANAARAVLEGADGKTWKSGWVDVGREIWPESTTLTLVFDADSRFYSAVKDEPVTIRIWIALTEYRENGTRRITIPSGDFSPVEGSRCAIGRDEFWEGDIIRCRSAMGERAFQAHLSPLETSCALPDRSWPSLKKERYDGTTSDEIGDGAGLVPIQPFTINFGGASAPRNSNAKSTSIICPGTSFEISGANKTRLYQMETEIDGIHLPNYVNTDF